MKHIRQALVLGAQALKTQQLRDGPEPDKGLRENNVSVSFPFLFAFLFFCFPNQNFNYPSSTNYRTHYFWHTKKAQESNET